MMFKFSLKFGITRVTFLVDVLLDSYTSSYSTLICLYAVHPSSTGLVSSEGQCFTNNQPCNAYLKSAKFILAKVGDPRGFLKAAVYNITGTCGTTGIPTGAPLEVSTNSISMLTLPTEPATAQFTFNFSGTTLLVSGTLYVIQVYVYSATVLDYSNCPCTRYDMGGGDDGNRSYYNWSAWHYGLAKQEIAFEVWGECRAKVGLHPSKALPIIIDAGS